MKQRAIDYTFIFVLAFVMSAGLDYLCQRSIELALLAGTFMGAFCSLCHKFFNDGNDINWK